MEWSRNQKWFSIALLGVILPVSLLVTFKLTGIIPEPLQPKTFRADVVSSNITRPSKSTTYGWVTNHYSDAVASVELKVAIGTYHVGDPRYAYSDYLNLKIVAMANMSQGFIQSVTVQFLRTSNKNSVVNVNEDPDYSSTECLKIEKIYDYSTESEAYIMATTVGEPENCSLTSHAYWIFLNEEEDIDHFLIINFETTYYNGTAYRKAILPIQIGVLKP